ncbi:MAG: chemotaxis protein CheW [Anaerolineae bacterium]|nr:chemotaxis protein CheW [Anaerolineae bacterium]
MAERENNLFAIGESEDIENLYLTFTLEDEEYGINIANVVEIVNVQRISEIPDVPPYIRGVINLRGRVIPIMDVRMRFGLPARPYTERTPVIVVELDGVPTGLVVDQVTDVVSISQENIVPPRRWNEGGASVVKGLGKHNDGVSIILDLTQLLGARQVQLETEAACAV